VPKDINELFSLPPEGFTAARDDLAKRMAAGGDKEGAKEVKGLRKPTLIAWALNQLARRHREDLESLIAAGDELRTAQRKAVSGVKGDFRAAMERRRKLVQALTHRAVEILLEAGRGSQSAEDEIGRTLEAASSDLGAAETLLRGRLSKPITSGTGFEWVAGLELVEGSTGAAKAERKAKETALRNAERQAEKAEADARRARIRADNLAQQAEDVSRRAKEAEREAEELERAAVEAKKHVDKVRKD
jgi:hypothetical protein